MDEKTNKCELEEHKEIDAIIFCQVCRVYMCNKCQNLHSKLFPNHQNIELNKKSTEIFIELCPEKNHTLLNYYCATHNILCCAACLSIVTDQNFGKHAYCDIYRLNETVDYKKKCFDEKIKTMKYFSENIESQIFELKKLYEKINEDKNKLIEKIQKIFTRLRNCLNEREDKILSEVDEIFNSCYFNKTVVEESENFPNKIKKYLEIGDIQENEWENENNFKRLINNCIKIEKNIDDINDMNECINKYNQQKDLKIYFTPNEEGIKNYEANIKKFGNIMIKNNLPKKKYYADFEFFHENYEKFNTKLKYDKNSFNKVIMEWLINKYDCGHVYEKVLKGAAIIGFNKMEWGSYNLSIKKEEIEKLIQFFIQKKENLSITSLELQGKKYFVIYYGKEKIYLRTEGGGATICISKNAFIIGIYSDGDHYKYDGRELKCCQGICNYVVEDYAMNLISNNV